MKMKWKISVLALSTAISFASFNTAAGTTADISVRGTIAPASCEPTLTNSAVVNYGAINSASLTATAPALNQLGSKKIALTITCTGQTLVAVKTTDNKASSLVALSDTTFIAGAGSLGTNVVSSEFAYGLDSTTGGVKIGAWSMAVDVSRVEATDGADVAFDADVLTTRDAAPSTATWSKANGGFLYPSGGSAANHISFAQKGTLAPVGIKTVTMPLIITAAVQPIVAFNNEEVSLNGNATIHLVYL